MIAIDTNVLVRFLVKDNEEQSRKAKELFKQQEKKDNNIFISNIVLVEIIWVLQSGYEVPKLKVISTVKKILSNNLFKFEDRSLIIMTLRNYERSGADFADYLIGNLSKKYNAEPTFTFDKSAGKDDLFELL